LLAGALVRGVDVNLQCHLVAYVQVPACWGAAVRSVNTFSQAGFFSLSKFIFVEHQTHDVDQLLQLTWRHGLSSQHGFVPQHWECM
jgi:hypothetical protein